MIFQFQKLFLVEGGQRGGSNIKLQMNCGRDFVHILSAGTLRPHRMDVDLRIGDGDVGRDVQHGSYLMCLIPLVCPRPLVRGG